MYRSILLATTLLLLISGPAFAGPPADHPRLQMMFEQDQAARGQQPIDWKKLTAQDRVRREAVLALLGAGALRTANDYYHAAMILQHGFTTADYELAFSLARLSATMDPGHKRAKWLSAAAWDRSLHSRGLPQWYGTQYMNDGPGTATQLYQVDASVVSDAERAALHVPTLAEAREKARTFDQ